VIALAPGESGHARAGRDRVLWAAFSLSTLLLQFWKPVLMGALVALAAFLLIQRVRELRA
jgi:hypothetical protein